MYLCGLPIVLLNRLPEGTDQIGLSGTVFENLVLLLHDQSSHLKTKQKQKQKTFTKLIRKTNQHCSTLYLFG